MGDDGLGGAEALGVGDIKEASAAQIEQMRENMRKAGEAVKKVQRDEAKKKKKENKLVRLLINFLKSNKDQDVLGLIVIMLEQKAPISFIVTILALGYE